MRPASSAMVPASRRRRHPHLREQVCIVRTSLRRGTLVSVSGSGVSSAAHRIGSAAFCAPRATRNVAGRALRACDQQLVHARSLGAGWRAAHSAGGERRLGQRVGFSSRMRSPSAA
jgi:hypothetical protein